MSNLEPLTEHHGIKLTTVTSEIVIEAPRRAIWDALSHYGDVSTFHAGVAKSTHHDGRDNTAALGAERTCLIQDGKREVTLVEKITDFSEGEYYRYEVFDWKNLPLRAMFFAFEIVERGGNEHLLRLSQHYRLKPGFLSRPMKFKIREQQRGILLGYKHYIETGEKNVPVGNVSGQIVSVG